MLKRNDTLPLYFDTINGNIALGLYLENEKKPSIFYLEKTSDNILRKLGPCMEEIGQVPIESKLVIESLETILKKQKSTTLEEFLVRCKKRAISDRKTI